METESSNSTRPSLLVRVRDSANTDAWKEFFDLYSPLLYTYAIQRGLNHDDAEDIRSSCYESIVRHIQRFDYANERTGFRAWLRTMVNRRVIDLKRKRNPRLAESTDLKNIAEHRPGLDEMWDNTWRLHHLRYCVGLVAKRVQPSSFEAFRLLTEEDLQVREVCDRMKMNADQVHQIKSRILRMVKEEMRQFELDD